MEPKIKEQSMIQFLYNRKKDVIFAVLAVIVCWRQNAFTQNIRVDTESFVANPGTLQGWMGIGRAGMLPLKTILGNMIYNPYYSGFLFLLFFSALAVMWMYFIYSFGGEKRRLWIFAGLFVSSQTWAYMFYFNMMSAEISVALLMQLGTLIVFTKLPAEMNAVKELKRASAVVLLAFSFSVYQAVIPVFVTGAAICILLRLENDLHNGIRFSFKDYLCLAANYILPFFLAFGLYSLIINRYFMYGDAYLNQMNWWKTNSKGQCIRDIINAAEMLLWKAPDYYSVAFGVGCAGAAVTFISDVIRGRLKDNWWMFLLTYAVLMSGPFVFILYLGGNITARMQFSLQLAGAFLCWHVFSRIIGKEDWKKSVGTVLSVVFSILMIYQFSVLERLYYTDDVRQKQDERVAEDIVSNIGEMFGNTDLPVVIVGRAECSLNGLCLSEHEMYGYSVLGWDWLPQNPTGATGRASGFIKALYGVEYVGPTDEQRNAAASAAEGKPCYPENGYVFENDGVIVVKLSN